MVFFVAYAAKNLSDKMHEAVGQPFGGKATKQPPQPCLKGDVPITNQIVDTLAGYLDNIVTAATNMGGGKELEDLADSMAILVDTNSAQEKELKTICEKINALKNNPNMDV